eukprot:320907-Pyramimonas_sp.AAC.1
MIVVVVVVVVPPPLSLPPAFAHGVRLPQRRFPVEDFSWNTFVEGFKAEYIVEFSMGKILWRVLPGILLRRVSVGGLLWRIQQECNANSLPTQCQCHAGVLPAQGQRNAKEHEEHAMPILCHVRAAAWKHNASTWPGQCQFGFNASSMRRR